MLSVPPLSRNEGLNGHGLSRPVDNKLFKGLEPKVGEQPALDDYIAAHPEWRIKEDRRQYPGMLIWERNEPVFQLNGSRAILISK